MNFSSRVLSELDRNLIGQLRFSFRDLDAQALRKLCVGDPIKFEIRIDNTSGLPLADIRGTLRHGARTRFPAVTFALDRLGPNASATIATICGVFRGPVDPTLVDSGLASIAVSTRIDLSQLLFEEWDRAVVIVPEASSPELPAPRAPRRAVLGKAIPLSAQ